MITLKAVIKDNKAYCPRCGERNYRIIDVKQAKGAIKYIARCKCEAEFEYLKTVKIGKEKVFTDYEKINIPSKINKQKKGEVRMIDTPKKLQSFMYMLMKEASRNSLIELMEECEISEKEYEEISKWFLNHNIKI